jgi:hypothetical protein
MTRQRHFFALKTERLKLDRVIQVKRMRDPRSRLLHNLIHDALISVFTCIQGISFGAKKKLARRCR